jgi:hypothetical protein
MSGVPAQMAAYNNGSSAAAPSTASFRPGSTGRQTNYNFSQPSQPSTFVNQTPPTFGVPAAKEASGLNDPGYNPGFQIPPTGTTFR